MTRRRSMPAVHLCVFKGLKPRTKAPPPEGICDRYGCKRKARVWLLFPWGAAQECRQCAKEDSE